MLARATVMIAVVVEPPVIRLAGKGAHPGWVLLLVSTCSKLIVQLKRHAELVEASLPLR